MDEKGKFATSDPQGQNDLTGDNATAKKQAASEGFGEKTVRRNAKYSEGIDVLKEHNPELATTILTNQKGQFATSEPRGQNVLTGRHQTGCEVVAAGYAATKIVL